MRENEPRKTTVQIERETIKQMLALYRAIDTASKTYTTGSTAFKLQVDLIAATAHARNVQRAFAEAAEAIGETL